MLYEYLLERYQPYEVIIASNIDLDICGNTLRPMLKELCDQGKLCHYDTGIYYLPGKTKLKGLVPIAPSIAAKCKYIEYHGNIEGYFSGYTFANQIGLSTQVPFRQEIVTNASSAKVREVEIKGQRFLLRKPRAKVTKENYKVLRFLDLLLDIEKYIDEFTQELLSRLLKLAKEEGITKQLIDQYICLYPDRIFKNLYLTGVVYAIT